MLYAQPTSLILKSSTDDVDLDRMKSRLTHTALLHLSTLHHLQRSTV